MDWLTNGSKTLVMVAAIVMLGLMAMKGVLTVESGGLIVTLALTYCGLNVYQNRGSGNPPSSGNT